MSIQVFPGKYYSNETFVNLKQDEYNFDKTEFGDCAFQGCLLTESIFNQCRFVNCEFKNCDLSLSKFPGSVFNNTSFIESKIIGINWAQASWSSTDLGVPIRFIKSSINHSTFIGLKLNGIQVKDCQVVNVDFREADLSNADFSGSDLSGSLFGNTNLTRANFQSARNYIIDPGCNELEKVKFSLPEAMSLLFNLGIILGDGGDGG